MVECNAWKRQQKHRQFLRKPKYGRLESLPATLRMTHGYVRCTWQTHGAPDPLRVKLVADLFHNSKRYISSKKVLRNALGSKARQKTSIVETRICGIRKKISKVGAATTIKAIRYRVYAIG